MNYRMELVRIHMGFGTNIELSIYFKTLIC